MIRNTALFPKTTLTVLAVGLLATAVSGRVSAEPAGPSPTPVPTAHVLPQPQVQRGSLNDRVQALKKTPTSRKEGGKATPTRTVPPKP